MNSAVAALRFFFTTTWNRAEMARHLTLVRQPQNLPVVCRALGLEDDLPARDPPATFRSPLPSFTNPPAGRRGRALAARCRLLSFDSNHGS
jgi:hypothetical protein